jgi:phytoene dehydrogenase-like protein
MARKIAVIGAGIAGLSVGCYARMNGFEAEIFETHNQPGGLCTAWKRHGYTFDGCLHWLTGSSPADNFFKLWEELGAIQDRKIIDHDIFYRFIGRNGQEFNLYTDVDRLEAHMKTLSPEDSGMAEHLCGLIRKFTRFKAPVGKAPELYNIFDIAKLVLRLGPYMKDLRYCNSISVGEYAAQFKDPFLRDCIARILYTPETVLFGAVVTLALLHNRAGGFPAGGSLEFARAIERRFVDLGGIVHYRSAVKEIRTEHGAATGIVLADGTEVAADYVVSAADLHSTLFELLEGRHLDPQHKKLFESFRLFPSMVQVFYGVKMAIPETESALGQFIHLEHPVRIGNEESEWLLLKDYHYDPSLTPPGKNVISCSFITDNFDYWKDLSSNKAAYETEKERIGAASAELVEQVYPGFKDAIETVDVVTPMTYVHYTGVWKGTFMTWLQTPESVDSLRVIKNTVPGLSNVFLAGMWVQAPGGVPTGALTGRNVVQQICRKERKRFTTSLP